MKKNLLTKSMMVLSAVTMIAGASPIVMANGETLEDTTEIVSAEVEPTEMVNDVEETTETEAVEVEIEETTEEAAEYPKVGGTEVEDEDEAEYPEADGTEVVEETTEDEDGTPETDDSWMEGGVPLGVDNRHFTTVDNEEGHHILNWLVMIYGFDWTETVAHDVTYVAPTESGLALNEQQIITQGKDGTGSAQYKKHQNPITKEIIIEGLEEAKTKALAQAQASVVNGVVAVGNTEITTKKIPYNVIYKDNPSRIAKPGEPDIVLQEGIEGVNTTTITYEVNPNTGELMNPTSTTEETVKKQDKIIERATGVAEPVTQITERTEAIPFETIRKDHPHLKQGEEIVIQEGEEGELKITTKLISGGEAEEKKEVIKEAKDRIILVGTMKPEVKEVEKIVEVEKIKEVVKEVPKEVIKELNIKQIVNITQNLNVEVLGKLNKEVPQDKLAEILKEVPSEKLKELSNSVSVEQMVNLAKEVPTEKLKNKSIEQIINITQNLNGTGNNQAKVTQQVGEDVKQEAEATQTGEQPKQEQKQEESKQEPKQEQPKEEQKQSQGTQQAQRGAVATGNQLPDTGDTSTLGLAITSMLAGITGLGLIFKKGTKDD